VRILALALIRFVRGLATLVILLFLVFFAIRLTPGGPAVAMLGQRATAREIDRLNHEMGWDRPVIEQFVTYLSNVAHGDLGVAYLSPGRPKVLTELRRLFPATVELSLSAMLLAVPIGIGLGMVAAAYRGRWPDRVVMGIASAGVSIPIFFLGILLLLAFPAMPGSGRLDVRLSMRSIERTGLYLIDSVMAGRWDLWSSASRHLILPAVTLSTIPMAIIARVTRSTLLETLQADFIRAARAKGASWLRVFVFHALPVAAVPMVSLLGLQLATLLAGAVLTETVFTWPGIGRYVTLAAMQKDYGALQGAVLLLGAVFILLNAIIDLLAFLLDPRLRRSGPTNLARGRSA
jgi:ABC-type dipeptide/oligopeptide/nickel transport system permease component